MIDRDAIENAVVSPRSVEWGNVADESYDKGFTAGVAAVLDHLEVPLAPPAHSCEWCQINYNHPKCPENADEPRCPHCSSDPEDVTMHAEGCPTVGTCASTRPDLPRPWHAEADWLGGEEWTLDAMRQHYATAHTPDPNGRCLSCGVHTGEAVEFCPDCQPSNEDDDL